MATTPTTLAAAPRRSTIKECGLPHRLPVPVCSGARSLSAAFARASPCSLVRLLCGVASASVGLITAHRGSSSTVFSNVGVDGEGALNGGAQGVEVQSPRGLLGEALESCGRERESSRVGVRHSGEGGSAFSRVASRRALRVVPLALRHSRLVRSHTRAHAPHPPTRRRRGKAGRTSC